MPSIKMSPDEVDDLKVVDREFIDHNRWSVSFDVIVSHEGKLYSVQRTDPATENQEVDRYFTDSENLVELVEVVVVEKLQTVYEVA